jgi:hypothetical protein
LDLPKAFEAAHTNLSDGYDKLRPGVWVASGCQAVPVAPLAIALLAGVIMLVVLLIAVVVVMVVGGIKVVEGNQADSIMQLSTMV